ncbi:MAG: hypothetical protein PHQ52_08055 [Candidatus Omnitrophica bacterium]|nr:hypothetical protein [Candidatus Omnitrophota bacterium]
MKKYLQPKIKAVMLDPDQAILQTCMVGGAYMLTTRTNYCLSIGSQMECSQSMRGNAFNANTRTPASSNSNPS